MPIHLRAAPGDYAPAVLLPGDPTRAEYIAARFLTGARRVNAERGLLGYTGTWRDRPVSVQATGMGAPSAAIVVEELVALGARTLLRVGTCGAVRPDVALGELLVVQAAVPADGTTQRLVGAAPHAPAADYGLLRATVAAAEAAGAAVRVGVVASCDVFYDPDPEYFAAMGRRGVLAVEMEAAVVLTLGALRGVAAGCALVVSDLATATPPARIADAALRAAVDRLAAVALDAATAAR